MIDRYLMFYAQSTAKGHIRVKQNVFLPQVKLLIHYLKHSIVEDLEKLGENGIEWARKAELGRYRIRSPVSRHSIQSYILTTTGLIALGSHQEGALISVYAVPHWVKTG